MRFFLVTAQHPMKQGVICCPPSYQMSNNVVVDKRRTGCNCSSVVLNQGSFLRSIILSLNFKSDIYTVYRLYVAHLYRKKFPTGTEYRLIEEASRRISEARVYDCIIFRNCTLFLCFSNREKEW